MEGRNEFLASGRERRAEVELLMGAIVFLASDSSALMALTLDDGCTAI